MSERVAIAAMIFGAVVSILSTIATFGGLY